MSASKSRTLEQVAGSSGVSKNTATALLAGAGVIGVGTLAYLAFRNSSGTIPGTTPASVSRPWYKYLLPAYLW